jgi:hypothetical protein
MVMLVRHGGDDYKVLPALNIPCFHISKYYRMMV